VSVVCKEWRSLLKSLIVGESIRVSLAVVDLRWRLLAEGDKLKGGVNKNRSFTLLAFGLSVEYCSKEAQPILASTVEDSSNAIDSEALKSKLTEERRSRLASIVENSSDAIDSKTLDGILVSLNPSAEKLYGYSEDEVKGKDASILTPPDRIEEMKEMLERVGRGETISDSETECISKDGRRIPLSLTVSPVKDAEGKIVGASAISRDITERKVTEEERSRLASIVENFSDAIDSKTLDGTLVSLNPSAEKLYGYLEDEVKGKDVSILTPPDRIEEMKEVLERVGRGETISEYETERVSKDGRLIPLSLTFSQVKDPDGKIVGVSAISRDITERKVTEEAHSRLASIVENSSDAIDSKALDGTLVSLNPSAEKLYGYLEDEVKGKDASILTPPDRIEEMKEMLERVGRGETISDSETECISKDGRRIPLSLTVSPVKDAEGNIVGASAISAILRSAKSQRRRVLVWRRS
jgi:PAS domain S-box-containing protein